MSMLSPLMLMWPNVVDESGSQDVPEPSRDIGIARSVIAGITRMDVPSMFMPIFAEPYICMTPLQFVGIDIPFIGISAFIGGGDDIGVPEFIGIGTLDGRGAVAPHGFCEVLLIEAGVPAACGGAAAAILGIADIGGIA